MFSFFNPELQLFIGLLSVTYLLPVICHFLRIRFGLGSLFAATATLTFLFWQMRLFGWWMVKDGWVFNVAHVAFVPCLLSALIFCYAFDGIRAARSCWLILLLSSILAIGFAVFYHQLTLFSPVPSFFDLPFSSHVAVLTAILFASSAALLCYEALVRVNAIFALVFSICFGSVVFIFSQSILVYGLSSGVTNFINHLPELLVCLSFSVFLVFSYGLYCYHLHFFLPARSISNILLFWRKTESNLSSDELLETGHIVSESRELNLRLSKSQQLQDFHSQHIPFAIVHTRADGIILSSNSAADDLFHLPSNTLINTSIYSFLTPHSLNDLVNNLVDPVINFTDADNHSFWHQYYVLPIYDAFNHCTEFQVIIKDVTQAQQSLITKNIERNVRNIHRTSKMLSHDIFNLFLGIEGSVHKASHAFSINDNSIFSECVDAIITALQQGRALLSQLNGGEALGVPKLADYYLQSLVSDSIKIAKASADNKHIDFVVSDDLNPLLLVDCSQIIRVFTNLLINAVRASSDSSSISITIKPYKNGFSVDFIDRGEAMSSSQVEHAFDPAFSTKGNGQGGLGLAISYLIIDAHGGYLTLSSNAPIAGMTANVWLPAKTHSVDLPLANLRLLLACSDDLAYKRFSSCLDSTHLDWVESQNSDEMLAMFEESWDFLLVSSNFCYGQSQGIASTATIPCIIEFCDDLSFVILKDENGLADCLIKSI